MPNIYLHNKAAVHISKLQYTNISIYLFKYTVSQTYFEGCDSVKTLCLLIILMAGALTNCSLGRNCDNASCPLLATQRGKGSNEDKRTLA